MTEIGDGVLHARDCSNPVDPVLGLDECTSYHAVAYYITISATMYSSQYSVVCEGITDRIDRLGDPTCGVWYHGLHN